MEVLPALGDEYGDAAAALAADYFDEARAEAGVAGDFAPVIAERPARARWEALARWGVDPLYGEAPAWLSAMELIAGGLQRTITDQHRATVADSAIADPQASGWRRVGVGDTCGFCRMLIDRGAVYGEKGVVFKSHDWCNCVASPSWAPNVRKVIGVPFKYSERKGDWSDERKARENRRVYDYIDAHYGDDD